MGVWAIESGMKIGGIERHAVEHNRAPMHPAQSSHSLKRASATGSLRSAKRSDTWDSDSHDGAQLNVALLYYYT